MRFAKRLAASCLAAVLFASCLFAVFGVSGALAAQGDTPGDLMRFFQSQESSAASATIDFQIVGGFAEIQTGSPDSSGRYYLASNFISRVTANIFRMDLTFSKKLEQDIISFEPAYVFTEKRSYFFWYENGDKIVFRVGGGKTVIPIARKEIMRVQIKSLETYTIDREKLFKDLQFGDASTMVFLQIKFI